MSAAFDEAVERVYLRLLALPQEDFNRLLEESKDHYICKILDETQALEARQLEAESFDDITDSEMPDMDLTYTTSYAVHSKSFCEATAASLNLFEGIKLESDFKSLIYSDYADSFRELPLTQNQLILFDKNIDSPLPITDRLLYYCGSLQLGNMTYFEAPLLVHPFYIPLNHQDYRSINPINDEEDVWMLLAA
jgi:hypothetical protein